MARSKKAESSKRPHAAEREEEDSAEAEQLYGAGLQRGRRRGDPLAPRNAATASSSPSQRSSPPPRSSSPLPSVSSEHPPPQPSSPPRFSTPGCSTFVRPQPAQPSGARSSSPRRYGWLRSSSSAGSSRAGSSPRSLHDLPRNDEGTPVVDLHLDDAESLLTALKGGKQYFADILKQDCVHLPEGKLVTHPKGSIVLRITPSASDMTQPIYALYRTKDLYLDSVLSRRTWYRFEDHDKDLVLPPEIPADGVVTLKFSSDYKSLNCIPSQKKQIEIGEDLFQKNYHVLLDAANNLSTDDSSVRKAFLWLVTVFSEALRFPALEGWLYETLASKRRMFLPLKITALFNKWGTFSKVLHEGRADFKREAIKNGGIKDREITEQWATYDEVCSLTGVVNRENSRKLLKTAGKRRARMKTAMGTSQVEERSVIEKKPRKQNT